MTHDWPHQTQGVTRILAAFDAGVRSVCFQLPTGGGKSRIIRRVVEHFHTQKKVIYIVTHRTALVRQLAGEIRESGLAFSLIMPGFPMLPNRIRVASLQTIIRRFHKIAEPELIVIDEAHHVASASYTKIFEQWPEARVLGVTATPKRTDGKPLSSVFGKLITGPAVKDLIAGGFLCDYDYYAPQTVDVSDVRVSMGEFSPGETQLRVDKRTITGNVIEHYRRYADHMPAIVSCVSIEHCEHVAAQFREQGYRAQAVHSKMDRVDEYIDGLRTGALELLCQCELLGEGVDIRGASVLIQLRPTMSIVVFLQHIGRVLRGQPGKRAIVLDHVGNYERHGLPDDPREWTLDGVDRRDNGVLKYKRCPQCFHPILKHIEVCPFCGFAWEPVECREIPQEAEGELVNVREISAQKQAQKDAIRTMAHVATIEEARCVAEKYGYKRKFADIVWTKILKKNVAKA